MRRVMIIGGPGSGKSTLASALGRRFDLPVYHMDREVHWLPGWRERAREEKPTLVAAIVARDTWVFEGGHSPSYGMRAARADLLIWLDLPLAQRLWRVIRRSFRDRGRTRPDMQDDCPEQIAMLPEFISFILRTNRRSRARQHATFTEASCQKHRLRTPAEVARFLRRVET